LKLIFLVVTRAVSVLGLSRRETWWKDAKILMLRHQLAVALRERPAAHSCLTWPDRAWLALLAGTLPAGRQVTRRTSFGMAYARGHPAEERRPSENGAVEPPLGSMLAPARLAKVPCD
jgi:hypothetical protein